MATAENAEEGPPVSVRTTAHQDVTLAYEIAAGAEGAKPLLLIGGNGTQMIHWPDEFCAALGDRGFQVARFDNRDSGRSTNCRDRPPYTLADMTGDAVTVMDALGWESAHIVGISLGGMIGQDMAIRYPSRVRSLTSMSSAPAWSLRVSRPRLRTLIGVAGLARRAGEGREAAGETWVRMQRLIGSPGYPLDEARARELGMRAYDIAHDPTAVLRQQAAIKAGGDRRDALRRLDVPTLVVHGEADPMQSIHAGRATAEAIRGARLVTFAGVGHDLAPQGLWPRLLDEICAVGARADD